VKNIKSNEEEEKTRMALSDLRKKNTDMNESIRTLEAAIGEPAFRRLMEQVPDLEAKICVNERNFPKGYLGRIFTCHQLRAFLQHRWWKRKNYKNSNIFLLILLLILYQSIFYFISNFFADLKKQQIERCKKLLLPKFNKILPGNSKKDQVQIIHLKV
jgi:hypothetical protein